MKYPALAGLLLLAATATVGAQTELGNITISKAWARAIPSADATAAVYFTVTDTGAPDRLVAVDTPLAKRAQLHQSKVVNGIMQMRPVDSLAIDKDHPITLTPDGYHLMLTGMREKLVPDENFPVNLTFAHAGKVQGVVTVQKAGSDGDDMGSMPGMGTKGINTGQMSH